MQVLIHFIEPVSRDLSDIAKTLVGFFQLRFMPLDVGDIRVNNDNAAIARFLFADLIPGAIATLEDDRFAGITVLGDTLAYPLLRILLGRWNEAIPDRTSDDALELVSYSD